MYPHVKKETEGGSETHLVQLASVGQIAAGIAHEVKNPLTAVRGFLQLLQEEHNQEYLKIAQSELNNALMTIENLLQVSKPDLDNEPFQLIKIAVELESLISLFQDQMYRVSIEKRLLDGDVTIYGKRNQIKKALFNLLKNAFEAIPGQGTVKVEHYVEQDYVVIIIKDTGVGISQQELSMLGTPFFTTKVDGTGMGLTQVYSVVHEHKGFIEVHSSENRGTAFIIKLPKESNREYAGVTNLNVEYEDDQDLQNFFSKNRKLFEKRLLSEAVTVKDKIDGILQIGNIDLVANAYRLVLYVVEGRELEMISFAKQEGVAWAKYSLTLAFKLEWVQTVRRVLWDFLYNYDRLKETEAVREHFFMQEKRINNLIDQFLNHFFVSYSEYKDKLIQAQKEIVDGLSVPIIPLNRTTCILPLIGHIDDHRVHILEEKVLHYIGTSRIESLIIDLSGVVEMESDVITQLLHLIDGMSLMGCKTVVTGMRAEVVKTIIRNGIAFDNKVTVKGTLEQALGDYLHT